MTCGGRAIILLASLAVSGSAAAQLAPEVCDALKAERERLTSAGVPQTMERGPEWAVANLSRGQLQSIKRFIEVGEQITFRCDILKPLDTRIEAVDGEPKDQVEPSKEGAAARTAEPTAGAARSGVPAATSAATSTVPPLVPRKPRPPVAETGGAPPVVGKKLPANAPPPSPAAKPATPKSKPNDAYVPLPGPAGVGLGGLDTRAKR